MEQIMQWEDNDVIYNAHVKKDKILYVTSEVLAIADERESNSFQINIKTIRCALPVGETVRLFWRKLERSAGESEDRWVDGNLDIILDLKKMYPDNKERDNAKKTELTRMAMIILKTVQDAYTGNTPIPNGYLAMHTGERLVKSYKCYARGQFGVTYITNLGVYLVINGIGLSFNIPFKYINTVTHNGDAVKLHHFVPIQVNNKISKDTNPFVIRMLGNDSTDAYKAISKILGINKETKSHSPSNRSNDLFAAKRNPLDTLKMKLINDEITEEEYEKMKKVLTD